MKLTREFYIPKGATKVAAKDTDAIVYIKRGEPFFQVMAFAGKRQKPDYHYRFHLGSTDLGPGMERRSESHRFLDHMGDIPGFIVIPTFIQMAGPPSRVYQHRRICVRINNLRNQLGVSYVSLALFLPIKAKGQFPFAVSPLQSRMPAAPNNMDFRWLTM